jgi:hypothetical protein
VPLIFGKKERKEDLVFIDYILRRILFIYFLISTDTIFSYPHLDTKQVIEEEREEKSFDGGCRRWQREAKGRDGCWRGSGEQGWILSIITTLERERALLE